MSKQTQSSRFILPSFNQVPEFYQRLLLGITNYDELATRILKRIEAAHAFRQVIQVRELARILIGIPIMEHQLTAQYYLVWCKSRESKYHDDALLERIIEQSQRCKTKAMFSRGAFEWYRGDNEAALYFYLEALKTSPTVSEYVDLSRTIAVVKGTEGFHKSAIKDLENLLPVIRYAEPRVYYDYLNTLAVEFGEVGRLEEAKNITRIVLTSPFAPAYPEWRETREEIEGRGWYPPRSVVAFTQRALDPNNLVRLPLPELSDSLALQSPPASQPARVFSIQEWKSKMPKQSNGDTEDKTPPRPTTTEEKQTRLKELGKMTTREKLLMIMNVIGDERVGDDLLLRALIVLEGLETDETQGS